MIELFQAALTVWDYAVTGVQVSFATATDIVTTAGDVIVWVFETL